MGGEYEFGLKEITREGWVVKLKLVPIKLKNCTNEMQEDEKTEFYFQNTNTTLLSVFAQQTNN